MGQPHARENAEYDHIGDRYSEAKTEPFRLHLEAYTLEKLAGDVRGARVLDLACGDGFYSRRFMRRGAAEVVGVDCSREMIALAQAAEVTVPMGCRYVCADVNDLDEIGPFDGVVASYLLNYARTRRELAAFCKTMRSNLRPGGWAVGANDYTDDGIETVRCFEGHGFRKMGPSPYAEGEPITYEFLLPAGRTFQVTNYFWRPATVMQALEEAGFETAAWHSFEVSPEGRRDFPPGFWGDLLLHRPLTAFAARA